ncbi:hypothetical protein D3C85_891760 [compost metagenome]
MPRTAAQCPVADVPARLGKERGGVGFDVGAECIALTRRRIDQPIDAVAVAVLADAFILEVGTPDQAAGGAANRGQRTVHGGAHAIDIGLAFGGDDPGIGAPVVREETCLLFAPVAFHLQLLAEQILIAVIEVHRLIMGKRLITQLQTLDRH